MRRPLRLVGAFVLTAAGTAALVLLSQVPYQASPGDHALIRLSWRTTGTYVEECRRPSPEELEQLPVHMRRQEICDGRMLPYRLRFALDERVILDEVIQPAGARGDRPLFVLREVAVPAGTYRVAVDWEAGNAGSPDGLTLDTMVRLDSREIVLVTYDVDSRTLVLREGGRQAAGTR